MSPIVPATLPDQDVTASPIHDLDFRPALDAQPPASDAELAELIEQDGRWRLDRGLPCGLDRYYGAVPDLATRPISLDAAIDISLRSIARADGCPTPDERHTECLLRSYPDLAGPIRLAALLSNQLISTASIDGAVGKPRPSNLPRWVGAKLDNGKPRYELTRPLGRGSSGTVFEAVDHLLSDSGHAAKVAVKLIPIDPSTAQRQASEATKARRIEHPGVVRVLDRGLAGPAELFLVYELVPGGDLQAWFDARHRRVDDRTAAGLVALIAQGVQAAHSAGLAHCDLKPSNILMDESGKPRVSDFGVATLADPAGGTGSIPLGNLAFAAPEQVRKNFEGASPLADVYALGGLLYYLLTGALPNGRTAEEVVRTHDPVNGRRSPPLLRGIRPDIDRRLERICARALHPRPEERYPTAGELAADLHGWIGHSAIAWMREPLLIRAGLWARRSPALAFLSAVCAFLVILGGFASGYFAHGKMTAAREVDALNQQKEITRDAAGVLLRAMSEGASNNELTPKTKQDLDEMTRKLEEEVRRQKSEKSRHAAETERLFEMIREGGTLTPEKQKELEEMVQTLEARVRSLEAEKNAQNPPTK